MLRPCHTQIRYIACALGQYLCVSGISSKEIDPNYYTVFNYTVDAFRIQDAYALARAAASLGGELTARAKGVGARALAAALPFLDVFESVSLEREAMLSDDDPAYLDGFFVPGIRLIGGLDGCLALSTCKPRLV